MGYLQAAVQVGVLVCYTVCCLVQFVNSMSDEFKLIDDEEEYEDSGKGNRFLGFMFGNVDNSGDLDVDYLDEVILCRL